MASVLAVALFASFVLCPAAAHAQRRARRESNANRRERIARQIAETYSHRYEAAGGGGYLRFKSSDSLQRNNEVTFFGSGTYFLNPNFGLLGDVHGAYGNAKIGNNVFALQNPQISEYTFTGGVQYRVYAERKLSASVFGTAGVVYGKFGGGSKGVPPEALRLWSSGWKPAFTAGVDLDYNFYPNLALRVAPTYVGTVFNRNAFQTPSSLLYVPPAGSSVQNNLGVNIGIVYRFGKQK